MSGPRPLRIAQLANFVGPVSGGIRTVLDHLGRGYRAAGAERILLVPGPEDRITETAVGIVVQVRSPRLAHGYRMVLQPWRVLDVLDQFRPSTVEVSDKWTLSPVARWAARRGIGSVLFSHERLDAALSSFLRRRRGPVPGVSALNDRLARAFDVVVVASDYAAAEWASTGTEPERVPLGVDLETFRPRPPRTDDGVLNLVLTSRLSREKNPQLAVDTALELHRRGTPVRLDVYGEGPLRKDLQHRASGAPVHFHGHLGEREQLARSVARADVALSVCPVEAFGLAVLEALASGVPVVSVDRGGGRELVGADGGGWSEPRAAAFADAVLELAARPREEVARAARRRAEQFRWSTSVDRMLALHRRLAADVPRRPVHRRWLA